MDLFFIFYIFNPSLFLIPAVYLSLALYIIISFYCLVPLHLCVSSTSSFCPLTPSFHFISPFFSSLPGLPHDSRTLVRPPVDPPVSPAAARRWISASSSSDRKVTSRLAAQKYSLCRCIYASSFKLILCYFRSSDIWWKSFVRLIFRGIRVDSGFIGHPVKTQQLFPIPEL